MDPRDPKDPKEREKTAPPDPRRAHRRTGWAVPINRLEAFTTGAPIAVEPEHIEAELARFWQRAAEQAKAESARLSVTRATLWNLVVAVTGEAAFQRVKTVLDEVAETVPARIVVVYTHRVPGSSSDSGELDSPFGDEVPLRAFIEANIRHRGALREVLGEEITLEAPALESRRLPGLVRRLLLPDLPTALFFPGPLPQPADPAQGAQWLASLVPLVAEADRLIIDTGRLHGPGDLRLLGQELPRPGEGGPREVADLGWLRIAAWRMLLASLFDPPEARAALAQVEALELAYEDHGEIPAYLLAGWLLARLGLAVQAAEGPGRWRLQDAAGRPVPLTLAYRGGRRSPVGLDEVRISAGGHSFAARGDGQCDTRCVELLSPFGPRRVQPVHGRPDADLLTAALHASGRDPLMYEALQHALTLLCGAAQAT